MKDENENIQKRAELKQQIKIRHKATLENCLKIDVLMLNIGFGLIKLVEHPDSELMEAIRNIRVNIAKKYGFAIPKIRIVANVYGNLSPNDYEIFLKGVKIGYGSVEMDKVIATDSRGKLPVGLKGTPITSFAYNHYNVNALLIDDKDKDEAIQRGYIVYSALDIIKTHINTMIESHLGDILTLQDVRDKIEMLRDSHPTIADSIARVHLSVIHQMLKCLLHDKIPIKDIITILEAIIEIAPRSAQSNQIPTIDYVRSALARTITDTFKSEDGTIKYFTLPTNSEIYLFKKIQNNNFALKNRAIKKLTKSLYNISKKASKMQIQPILIVDMRIRYALAGFAEQNRIPLVVLCGNEITTNAKLNHLGKAKLKF